MQTPLPSNTFEYDPNRLLDVVRKALDLNSDLALSRALYVAPPIISKVRHFKIPVSAGLLISMHEVTDWDIKELRALMGDHRERFEAVKLDK